MDGESTYDIVVEGNCIGVFSLREECVGAVEVSVRVTGSGILSCGAGEEDCCSGGDEDERSEVEVHAGDGMMGGYWIEVFYMRRWNEGC